MRIEFKMIADVPDDYFDLNELPEIAKELKAEMIKFAVNLQYLFETLAEAKDLKEEPDVKIERLEIACIS